MQPSHPGHTAATPPPNGLNSQYHVYANGIDWSKPVGVVFYIDGDYWRNDQSKIHSPEQGMLPAMGRIANARNIGFCTRRVSR